MTALAINIPMTPFVGATVTPPPTPVIITLGNLSYQYDGNDKSVTYTTNPVLDSSICKVDISYVPSGPNKAGTYAVSADVKSVHGHDCDGYSGSVSGTLVITPVPLTVTGITASNKTYDASTSATINTSGAVLNGKASGDHVTANYGSAIGTFSDKNVGIAKLVTISGITLSGPDSSDYTLTQPTTTANITALNLTVTATVSNKVYDGTTVASTTLSTNKISTDNVTATYATSTFNNKNVGTSKPVTITGIAITGSDASNYNLLNTSTSTTANITQRPLVITVVASDKVYDATSTASTTLSNNALVGDVITVNSTSSKFSDANVGISKLVTVSGGANATSSTANNGNALAAAAAEAGPNIFTSTWFWLAILLVIVIVGIAWFVRRKNNNLPQ